MGAMTRNTPQRWGSVSIGLHWTIAVLILLVQMPAGWIMTDAAPGATQNFFYNVHKNVGLLIFVLAIIRLAWRWSNPVPELPADLPQWQATAARVTHNLLYILLFTMPITGFLYTSMGGFPVPVLMLYDLSQHVPVNKPVAEIFKYAHLTGLWLLYLTAGLHIAGALQHHLVRRDWVLRRMLSATTPLPVVPEPGKAPAPGRL
jgi:cytochrome b561